MFGEVVEENLKGMEQWIGGLAVVTGASSGIGACVARKLVKAGVVVVGLARRFELLEDLQSTLLEEKGTFHPKQCDISNEEEILETFQWVEETFGPISILINSAGVVKPTNLMYGETSMWQNTYDVNVLAVCIASREAIRSMKKHGIDGHVVNISCLAGHVYGREIPLLEPALNVYPATKYMVNGITEVLRKEMRHQQFKIKISCVSPGTTETDLFHEFPAESLTPLDDATKLQPEDVANAVIYVLAQPPGVQVHELVIRPIGTSWDFVM